MNTVLVDFLDGGSLSTSGGATGSSSGHAAGSSSGCLVQLGDDGVADGLELLLLVFELILLGGLVAVQPPDDLLTLVLDLLPVIGRDLVLELKMIVLCPSPMAGVTFSSSRVCFMLKA